MDRIPDRFRPFQNAGVKLQFTSIRFSTFSTLFLLVFLVSPPFLTHYFCEQDSSDKIGGGNGQRLLYFMNDGALYSAGKLKSHDNLTSCLAPIPLKADGGGGKAIFEPPICTIQTSEMPHESLGIDCIDLNVLRITGDYNVLYISCSASYPLDFHFDGIRPTEGIYATFRNTLVNNDTSWPPKVATHHLDIQVFSINTLFRMVSRPERQPWFLAGRKNMTIPPSIQKGLNDYSRSGNFEFSGYLENANLTTSIYLFLEEKLARPSFIRNENVKMKISVIKPKSPKTENGSLYNISVPCRPTHYLGIKEFASNSTGSDIKISMYVEYTKSTPVVRGSWTCSPKLTAGGSKVDCNVSSSLGLIDAKMEFDETIGFTMIHTKKVAEKFSDSTSWGWKFPGQTELKIRCLMEQNGVELDRIEFQILGGNASAQVGDAYIEESLPPPGYDSFASSPGVTIEYSVDKPLDVNISETGMLTRPSCKIEKLPRTTRPSTATLTNIDLVNSVMYRLVRHFVLPDFSNRSWSLQWGQQETELNREFSILAGSPATCMATFCGENSDRMSVMDGGRKSVKIYGVPLDGKGYIFDFDIKWSNRSRDLTEGKIFLSLKLLTPHSGTQVLYTNTDHSFRCTVNQFALVRPVIWYTERSNGTMVLEHVDTTFPSYTIHSNFTTKMGADMKRVFCAASLWNKVLWKNVSIDLNLQQSSPPYFLPAGKKDHVQKFPLYSENQLMKCNARGSPQPNVYWMREFDQRGG